MLWTLPNLLTVSRILVIPVIIGSFYLPQPFAAWIGCGLFTYASVTDWLDGYIARRRHQVSAFGRFLDPIADKLLVAACLMMLVAFQHLGGIEILPALVILAREILVSGLREFLAGLRVSLPVSALAKWKTALQMAALGTLLVADGTPSAWNLGVIGQWMLWLAALLTFVTGYDYLRAGLAHMADEDQWI